LSKTLEVHVCPKAVTSESYHQESNLAGIELVAGVKYVPSNRSPVANHGNPRNSKASIKNAPQVFERKSKVAETQSPACSSEQISWLPTIVGKEPIHHHDAISTVVLLCPRHPRSFC
jgi:hypothetical protein